MEDHEKKKYRIAIAKRIKNLLSNSGMKISQLASEADISVSTMQRILSGDRLPDYLELVLFAESFGITVKQLVDFDINIIYES